MPTLANLILIFIATTCPLRATTLSTPNAVVNNLHESLIEIMKFGNEKTLSSKYDILEPKIRESFDFSKIAHIVTGKRWKSASDKQKSLFVTSLLRMSTATYIRNFKRYSGEQFKIQSSKVAGKKAVVETIMTRTRNKPIEIRYMLRKNEDVWRIINVIAEGVSDLSLKRVEYTRYLEKNSLQSLSETLSEKSILLD